MQKIANGPTWLIKKLIPADSRLLIDSRSFLRGAASSGIFKRPMPTNKAITITARTPLLSEKAAMKLFGTRSVMMVNGLYASIVSAPAEISSGKLTLNAPEPLTTIATP